MGYTHAGLSDKSENLKETAAYPKDIRKRKLNNILAIAVIIILPFIVYLPVTTGYATFAGFDHTGINQPLKQAAFESMRNGHLPLWEHRLDRGMPLFAEGESGLFYPLNLLFLIPGDFLTIYNYVILLCLSIAGLLFYFWIRKLGAGIAASTVAAIAHQWGSTVNFNKANMNILEGFILVPLMMLLLEREGDGAGGRDRPLLRTAALSLVFASMIFAGQSQYVVYTLLFCAVYIIVRAVFAGRSGYIDILKSMGIPFACGTILGAGISAVQLLSTLELIPLSERGVYSLYDKMSQAGLWLSPGRLFATFIFPAYHYSLEHFLPYLSTTVYVGPVALLLTGYAIRFRHRLDPKIAAMVIPLCVTALIFLWLAMGSNVPGAGWFISLGPLGSFRGHGRLGGYFAMVVTLLMGLGLDTYLKTPFRNKCDLTVRSRCMPLFIVELLILALLTIPFIVHRAEYLETRFAPGLMLVMILIFIAGLAAGAIFRTRKPLIAAVIIVVAMQIFGFQTTSSETILQRSSWDADRPDLLYIKENSDNPDQGSMIAIRTQASVRIHERILQSGLGALESGSRTHIDHLGSANAGIMEDLVVCNADLPLELARWEWLVHRILWPSIDTTKGDIGVLDANLIDRLGINWIVTENPDLVVNDWERISEPRFTNRNVPFYLSRRAALTADGSYHEFFAPRHSFYWDWKTAPKNSGEQEIRDTYINLLESEPNPTWAFVEGLEPGDMPHESDSKSGTASLAEWISPTEYKVAVTGLTSEAIFVFRDQWYPGWSVRVNGQAAKLLRADLVFKAVKLQPGRSEVVFRYTPKFLTAGWAITVLSLVVIVGSFWLGFRENHKRNNVTD